MKQVLTKNYAKQIFNTHWYVEKQDTSHRNRYLVQWTNKAENGNQIKKISTCSQLCWSDNYANIILMQMQTCFIGNLKEES